VKFRFNYTSHASLELRLFAKGRRYFFLYKLELRWRLVVKIRRNMPFVVLNREKDKKCKHMKSPFTQ